MDIMLRFLKPVYALDSDSFIIHLNIILLLTCSYDTGVDSASNRNEYQKYFLGIKAAGA